MHTHIRIIFVTVIVVGLFSVTSFNAFAQETDTVPAEQGETSVLTTEHDPKIANDWMMLTYELVRDENLNAPEASRVYAYTGIALYEAVSPGIPGSFSIGGQIEGLGMLPFPEPGLIMDYPAAANASLHTVVTGLFNEIDADSSTFERIDAMREMQTIARQEEVGEDVVNDSLAFGDAVGEGIVNWFTHDNYLTTRGFEYELPAGDPSLWVLTSENSVPMEPYWDRLRPFGIEFAERCHVPMRMPFSTDPTSTFYKQAQEILETSDNLTEEQQEISLFWIDTPGITGAPSGHWVLIEMQLTEQLDLDLGKASEMYVLVGMALGDAFISAWSLKYTDNLVRPVTYIQQNLRRNWTPYVETPQIGRAHV